MDITVTFKNGSWITDPDPAIVIVGTKVRWILRAPEQKTRELLWKVVFTAGLPFGESHVTLEAKTQVAESPENPSLGSGSLEQLNLDEEANLKHRGVTESLTADHPGDFKYDLIVQDAATGDRIGDDDPWLHVVRGVARPEDLHVL